MGLATALYAFAADPVDQAQMVLAAGDELHDVLAIGNDWCGVVAGTSLTANLTLFVMIALPGLKV
jgi:hypothetical protein